MLFRKVNRKSKKLFTLVNFAEKYVTMHLNIKHSFWLIMSFLKSYAEFLSYIHMRKLLVGF